MLIVLLLVSLFVFPSCTDDLFGAKKPESISIEYLSGKLTSGNTIEFSALSNVKTKLLSFSSSLKLRGGDYSSSIYWRVLRWNGSVSTDASSAGKITIIGESEGKDFSFYINSPGTYEVITTAKDDQNIKKSIKIIVGGSLETLGISMEGEGADITGTISLYSGESAVLYPIFQPGDTTQTEVKWTTDSNSSISLSDIPSSTGKLITAKAPGTTNITLSSVDNPSISKTITVKVSLTGDSQSLGASTITINPSEATIPINSYLDISAIITDEHGNELSDGTVSFSSSNPSAIKVDALSPRTARLSSLASGSAIIKAYYNDTVWKSFPLTVQGALESITLSSSSIRLISGDSSNLTVSFYPSDTLEKELTLNSSDNSVVSASLSGKTVNLKAKGEGNATITVSSLTNPSIKAEAKISVSSAFSPEEKVQRIEINPSSFSFNNISGSKKSSAIQYYREDDGSIVEKDAPTLWTIIQGEDVITGITNGNEYIVTPKSYGNAVIRATSSLNHGVYAEASIFVGGELKTLLSETDTVIIKEGDKTEVKLFPYPSDAIFSSPVIKLSEDKPAAVTINNPYSNNWNLTIEGKESGKSRGDVYVDGVIKTKINIVVEPKEKLTVKKVLLSSQTFSLKQDSDPVTLVASAYDTDGLETSSDFSYSILGKGGSIVEVKQVGSVFYITPKNSGSATIVIYSTSNPDASSSCRVEVGGSPLLSPTLRSISLLYNSITLQKGSEINLEVRTIPLDAEANLSWQIEDPGIVEIKDIDEGKATLSAKREGRTRLIVTDTNTGLTTSLSIAVTASSTILDTRIARTIINDGNSIYQTNAKTGTITLKPKAYSQDGSLFSSMEYLWFLSSPSGNVSLFSPQDGKGSEATISWNGYDTLSPSIVTAYPVENPDAVSEFILIVGEREETIAPASLSVTLEKGKEITVHISLYPESTLITVSASSPFISLSLSGNTVTIKAEESGVVTISSKSGNKAEINVNVVEKAKRKDFSISHISLDREYLSYDIAKKEMQRITATLYDTNHSPLKNEGVIWETSDSAIVEIISNGNTVLISPTGKTGYSTITARAENNSDVSASTIVEVVDTSTLPENLRSITLSSSSISLDKGRSHTLSFTVSPESVKNNYSYRWTSSNPSIATVDNGRITAIN